jgi:hypothetical protein
MQLDQNDFIGRSATAVEERDLRREMATLCSLVEPQDLAEILKWPFCVGEAQKLALAELERKRGASSAAMSGSSLSRLRIWASKPSTSRETSAN